MASEPVLSREVYTGAVSMAYYALIKARMTYRESHIACGETSNLDHFEESLRRLSDVGRCQLLAVMPA